MKSESRHHTEEIMITCHDCGKTNGCIIFRYHKPKSQAKSCPECSSADNASDDVFVCPECFTDTGMESYSELSCDGCEELLCVHLETKGIDWYVGECETCGSDGSGIDMTSTCIKCRNLVS